MNTSEHIKYTEQEINNLKYTNIWRGTLSSPKEKSKGDLYKLYATGYATLNGREFISLPAEMVITSAVKRKYNLI